MEKRLMLFFTYLLISVGLVTAQTKKVTGVVTSEEDGLPVIGAAVTVQGTTMGTITDFDGNFSLLNVPESAKNIEVSYVGMKNKVVAIKEVLNIVLSPDSELLDEVVVTGYGTFKKSSFTGSASSLSTEKLQDVPALSVSSKLAGGVSGVQITSTSGQPGAVESVRIRGMGSINASNEPLYVIDGVPMYNGDVSGFGYSQGGTSLLSTINSNDIESMTVIKDAAAASLYGSRAANGVIVITTKKGSAGKTNFNFKSSFGFSNMAINYRPVLNGEDRRELLGQGLYNFYMNDPKNNPTPESADAFVNTEINKYAAKPWSGYSNWKDILFQTGSHQNYEFSAQGGSEKTKFYSSMSYTKQEGLTSNSGFERMTGNANVNHTANRVTLDFNTMISYTNQSQMSEGTGYGSPIMVASMTASPSSYPYNKDGSYNTTSFPALNGANIVQTMKYNYDRNSVFRSMSTASVSWNIWDNLRIKEVFNFDFNQANNRVWWDPRTNDGESSQGVYQKYLMNRSKWSSQTQLTYDKVIAEKHAIDALVGFETEDYTLDYLYGSGTNYPGYLPEIANAGTTRSSSSKSQYRMTSMLGRLNYTYDNKYYFSASYRRDGSSRLASDSRWGNFWSVSGSWRMTQEDFMENVRDVLTDVKVRASYGVNGTQPSDYYGYMGVYSYGDNYNGKPGASESRFYNPDLSWEKNYATNIGFDISLWNRLSLSFDWYNRDTKDLLLDQPISQVTGIGTILKNVGSMRNRGFEFEIKSTNIATDDWFWTTSLNLGHNKNKLTKLDGLQQEVIGSVTINKVGKPYYSLYAYEYAGVDPETGKESYYINDGTDNSRNTTTNSADAKKVIIGSVEPKVSGGLTNFVSWKDFDLNFTFTYSFGGKAYDRARWLHSNGGADHYEGSVPSYYKIGDMWQKPGDHAKLPQFAFGNVEVESSRWMMSTNHVRLKNITLGYKLPNSIIRKVGLNKVRAYASASNLFTIKSKDLYVDPEVPANGLVMFESPALRTVTFGIEVGF